MKKSLDVCSRSQLKKCSHGTGDRISSLPDDVLFFILSFLTSKEVVKTSILSRRWLDLWVHSPVLNFHAAVSHVLGISDKQRRNYVKWVNSVLRRHKGHYLEEFKIVCDLDKRNRKDIERWLVFASARKVQRLELNLLLAGEHPYRLRDNYVFPGRFLNFSHGSRCPPFDLACLKSLSLKRVDVTGEDINLFLLNCPFLERLEVVGTNKLVDLVISDPTLALKHLQILGCDHLEVLSSSNFNLVSLDISTSIGDLTLTDVPMLVNLSILALAPSDRLSHSLSQAFSCHSQLESLTLEGFYLKDVTHISSLDQLTKLRRLVILVGTSVDESLTELVSLINSCPHLEEFIFKLHWMDPVRTSRTIHDVERLNCSPSLKSKSLKVFEFLGYYGRISDIELIMLVVENFVGLEKIIIDPRDLLLISPYRSRPKREQEARSIALQQFHSLRESIPQHIRLLIR